MNTYIAGNVFHPGTSEFEKGFINVQSGSFVNYFNDDEESKEIDCTGPGMMIVPGLIDLHVHVYYDATVLGVEPDKSCLGRYFQKVNIVTLKCLRGVTTVVDGGSAGCMTFAGLKRFVMEPSDTRVLAWLHIACHGLAGAGCSGPAWGAGGEVDSVNVLKV